MAVIAQDADQDTVRPIQVRPQAVPMDGSAVRDPGRRPGAQPGGVRRPGDNEGNQQEGMRLPADPPAQQLPPEPGAGEVVLPVLAEALELRALVEYVAETLQINVAGSEDLTGSVVITAPMTVQREDLLDLLDALLEMHGFTIVEDRLDGWYRVVRMEGVTLRFHGDTPTTRIIATPTVRPSSLAEIINTHLVGAAPGVPARQSRLAYLDDLGVIVVTDTPRRIDMLTELVMRVLERGAEQQFMRFDLEHLAASVARQRVLELIGQPGAQPGTPGQPAQPGGAAGAGTMGHLADRLIVDQQGNALILRGFPEEASRVDALLHVIDVPHQLKPRQYFAGGGVMQIAQMAERFGFGRVEMLEPEMQNQAQQQRVQPFVVQTQAGRAVVQQQQQPIAAGGGPVLVVDAMRGTIIYYGTETQHRSLEALIDLFEAEREVVEIRAYKVKNQRAEEIAELLNGLVHGVQPVGTSPFMPQQPGTLQQMRQQFGTPGTRTPTRTQPQRAPTRPGGAQPLQQRTLPGTRGGTDANGAFPLAADAGDPQRIFGGAGFPQEQQTEAPGSLVDGAAGLGGEHVFILADRANNQILIKAPAKQQEEFARLVEKLDQRRPQVFIEVQIVSVSASDDFRLAFETQLINAQGRGGVVGTHFGIGRPAESGDIRDPVMVPAGLSGLTAALIRNDQVPIIINALKREADTRILSSPRLLVDDNEMAEIVSLELQPTTGAVQGVATTQVSFTGFEEAGTRLLVTPGISSGGYLRLEYEIELSNFVGVATTVGEVTIPPPKQTREIRSDSVTIPGDTTIVVGGIEVDSQNKTIMKVPLLGDIPLVGHLFRDTGKQDASTRLYVFITPRILRDQSFRDLILLTRGPHREAGIALDMPPLQPVMIELIELPASRREVADPAPATPTRPEPEDPWPWDLEDPMEY